MLLIFFPCSEFLGIIISKVSFAFLILIFGKAIDIVYLAVQEGDNPEAAVAKLFSSAKERKEAYGPAGRSHCLQSLPSTEQVQVHQLIWNCCLPFDWLILDLFVNVMFNVFA